jgi:beta-phosphoglucomutase
MATSSLRYRALEIIEILDITDLFEVIITAEDVEKHKPNPELFLKAAEKLGVNPKECVVIEDAVNGIQAANSAKMFSIALLTKFHNRRSEFKEADKIISNLEELKKFGVKNGNK